MKEIIRCIKERVKAQIGYYELPKSLKLIVFCVSFLIGIFCGDLIFSAEFLKLSFVVVLLILFVKKFLRFERTIFLVILGGFILGIVRLYFANLVSENEVSNYLGKWLIKGCIVDEVDVRNDKIKYTFEVSELARNEQKILVSGRVMVTAQRYPLYEYGDCFLLDGEVKMPDEIDGFDYQKYLQRYGIHAVIYQPKMRKIDSFAFGLFKIVFAFKGDFEMRISRVFAEPYAGFMAGLILGSRRGMDADLTDKFNITGLSHIVAVSGYNITMLIVVVSGMLGFLERKKKVIASMMVIILFVFLVGAGASVVRAAIMGGVGLLALWFGRTYFVSISLFMAAFLMNVFNPLILLNDVGFQLSFLATCGLVYVSPLMEKYFAKETMRMTISAQVLALPIILLNFGRLSLISPFANILVLPFVPMAMFFGFLAIVCGYLSNFISLIFGFIAYLIMGLMIYLVRFFAAVPLAAVNVGWFNFWLAAIYYFVVVSWIVKKLSV